MDEILFYIILECIFFIIFRESMDIFFEKKNMSYFIFTLIWIGYFGLDSIRVRYITNPILLLLMAVISDFLLGMVLYYGNAKKKLIWIVIVNLMGMASEVIVACIFIFAKIPLTQMRILGAFISKILFLLLVRIVRLYHDKKRKQDKRIFYWCMFFFIPLGSIFILSTIFFLCEDSHSQNASILSMISSAFILALNFLSISIYEGLSEYLEIQKQQIIFDKQIEFYKEQIDERKEADLNIKSIRHDMKNHLICILECLEQENWDYAKKYVDDLLNNPNYFKNNDGINSGNIVIDALLNHKNTVMTELRIKMITHIEIPDNLEFNDVDICVILGNCLDNAIEAVSKVEDETNRVVRVEIVYRRGTLLIKITNPYIGKLKKDKHGNFLSTKADTENHGIGLTSVKNVVRKYDGIMNNRVDNHIFIVQILLYELRKNYI